MACMYLFRFEFVVYFANISLKKNCFRIKSLKVVAITSMRIKVAAPPYRAEL